MTRITVDVLHITHTCPAEPGPHTVDTRRTVVAVEPAGACQQPRTVRSGAARIAVDCHRVLALAAQCPACRTDIVIRRETTIDGGPVERSCREVVPAERDSYPCRICGEPLVAVFADYGAHLLCRRRRGWRVKP